MSDSPLGPEASRLAIIRVGLDASPLRIGYAITTDHALAAFGTIRLSASDRIDQRREAWIAIRQEIRIIETRYRGELRQVGIEAPYVGPNRQGTLQHARTIGHHEAFAYLSFPDAEHHLIQPQSWRAALGLKRMGKEEPRAYATKCLDEYQAARSYEAGTLEITIDQDTADAICIVKALAILQEL